MVRAVVYKVALAAGLAVLAGCATTPEMSRATSSDLSSTAPKSRVAGYVEGVGVVNTSARSMQSQRALSRLSQQFRREVPYVVTFDFNSSQLDAEARRVLDLQARWISRHSDVRFAVAGHTDKVGNEAYNKRLGMKRAKSAVAYLVGKGIEPDRLVAMVSHGENAPVVKTEDRERANRRVETQVMEFIMRDEDGTPVARSRAPQEAFDVASNGGSGGNGGGNEGNGGGNGGGTGGNGGGTGGNGGSGGNGGGDTGNGGGNGGGKDKGDRGGGSKANSGRGNGAEGSDPGKSGGKNQGGDID